MIQVNSGTNASVAGVKRADFTYDALGRQTLQRDYEANGVTIAYSRSAVYNTKNQVTSDSSATKRGTITYTADSTYSYVDASNLYYLGSATQGKRPVLGLQMQPTRFGLRAPSLAKPWMPHSFQE